MNTDIQHWRDAYALGKADAALEAVGQDAVDANRYRWLRKGTSKDAPLVDGEVWVVKYSHTPGQIPSVAYAGNSIQLDAAIDAAINSKKGGAEG
ncbi:MAG: hypothetical protein JO253_03215 [Alphaproteobacteria bacterium]|nr:hypothetical protein [Alphaproteobacteria bacterium]